MKYSFVITCLLAIAPLGLVHAQSAEATAAPTAEQADQADQAEKADQATAAAAAAVDAAAQPTSTAASVVGTPEAGKAQIVFFRASKFTGSAIKVAVYEGDKPLGVLKSGTYFVVSAEPGKHEYAVNAKGKDPLPMELEAGETYYVNGSISMGFVKGNSNLSPSDAAAYQADLPKLKKLGR